MPKYIRQDRAVKYAELEGAYKIAMRLGEFDTVEISDEIAEIAASKPHGTWGLGYICCNCHESADYFVSGDVWIDKMPNFCPNCGADMRETENVNP